MLLLEAGHLSEAEHLLYTTVRDKKHDAYGWLALGITHLRRWQQEPKVLHACKLGGHCK